MRPGLLHREQDVDLGAPAPHEGRDLEQDLELPTLIDAMAAGDRIVAGVAGRVLLDPLRDEDAIAYRQEVLQACLAHPRVPRALYGVAVRTLERRKKVFWGLVRRPDAVVHQGLELLNVYLGAFRELRAIADAHADRFGDDGLGALLARLRRELDDDFLADLGGHLQALRFRAGVTVSARLGSGNTGDDYVLERPSAGRPRFGPAVRRLWDALMGKQAPEYTHRLPPHDDSGVRALAELQAHGLERTANAIAQASDDLLWFFRQLRGELAFYVGCVTLHERLTALGAPTCFPRAGAAGERGRYATGLYDASLSLTLASPAIGNDFDSDAQSTIVTGANQGGKTTFLRSVGCAQLMMQCGMFVPAHAFRSPVAQGVFTHFTRQEDAAMRRGRLDDELARLDRIVADLTPGSLLLLNESFASTNEREGSELATGIVRALSEAGVRILFVTHLSQFARDLFAAGRDDTHFLLAERRADGTRTFRMVDGEPTRTSYGADLYRSVFEAGPDGRAERAAAD